MTSPAILQAAAQIKADVDALVALTNAKPPHSPVAKHSLPMMLGASQLGRTLMK